MTRPNQALPSTLALIAVLLLALNLNPAFSQQRWSIGPRVGANISTLNGDIANNIDTKWLPGWSVGGFIMYSDIRHFGISGDVLYSQKGAKYEGRTVTGQQFSLKERINYLEIPILARYFLTLTGKFRPNVFLGPSVAFLLNAKQKDITTDNKTNPDVETSEFFRPADLGIVGGVAFNFEVAKGKRVLLDARYTFGIADITLPANTLRNSAVTLNLSYGFGIGKKYSR